MSPTGCSVNSEMQVSYGSTTKFGGELEEQEVTSVWEMNCEQMNHLMRNCTCRGRACTKG
jgi:hypothetical protein